MNCKKTYKYICENLDEDFNSPICSEIKEHLKNCPNCTTYLDTLKKTVILYREYQKPSLDEPAKKRLHFITKLPHTSKKTNKKR